MIRSRHAVPIVAVAALLLVPAAARAQDQQVGQQGAVWNLGELAPGTYPSTVTAVNESCPGAHDFHVSLLGEAAEFLTIIGPTVLTDIPPGQSRTSEVYFDLRSLSPGPHNEGQVAVRCVDCPVTCSQDYDLLTVQLTVTGDGSAPASTAAATSDPLWGGIDLTTPVPTVPSTAPESIDHPDLRWIIPEALGRMTPAQDAVADDLAEVVFSGTGHAAGRIFTVQITRRADTPFEMGFQLGSLIVPDDPAYSPMMVADNGAVALLDEVTTVVVSGYLLDPRLRPPPAGTATGGESPAWSVATPPDSGPFATAIAFIEAAYELAGSFSTALPLDNYFQVVVQRTIWAETAPDEFDEERLQQDILAQMTLVGKVAAPEQVEEASGTIWDDLSQVANRGKNR